VKKNLRNRMNREAAIAVFKTIADPKLISVIPENQGSSQTESQASARP
jgi:hypothetical protein